MAKKIPVPDILDDPRGHAKALAANLNAEIAEMSEVERLEFLLRRAHERLPRYNKFGKLAVPAIENEMQNIANLERKLEKARKKPRGRRRRSSKKKAPAAPA